MLEISFYPQKGEEPQTVDLTAEFYKWLIESNFKKIGKTRETKLFIEGEEDTLPLVKLDSETRKLLRDFLGEAIIRESEEMLEKLGDSPSKEEYQKLTYPLKKLHELLKCVENEKYQYLQRV